MSVALDTDRPAPRRFWLVRHHDVSGVSGTEIVAEGIRWSSGQVALHWPGKPTVTSMWNSLDDLLADHGHGGWTTIEWLDSGTEWHDHDCVPYVSGCIEVRDGAIFVH